MEPPSVVIVNLHSNETNKFSSNEITFGRNPNNSIDIPDRAVSRHQCTIKWSDSGWTIEDNSSIKSTKVNDEPLSGGSKPITSRDVISFSHCPFSFKFFSELDYQSFISKKRKTEVTHEIPHKLFKSDNVSEPLSSEEPDYKKLYETTLALYEATFAELEEKKATNSDLSVELDLKSERNADLLHKLITAQNTISLLEKDKDKYVQRLALEDESKEKMLLEMQDLIETIKELEEEKNRLVEEAQQREVLLAESKNNAAAVKPKSKDDDEYFSRNSLLTVVDIVETKTEVEKLRSEILEKVDKITDLTLERERHHQELLEMIDRELHCSICSDVLCHAITLNCMHTFCDVCLGEWKDKKKECPVCRTRIKVEVHPLALDSFIDKICDFLGGDLKSRRDELKSERCKFPQTPRRRTGTNRRPPGTPRRRRTSVYYTPGMPPLRNNPVPMFAEGVIDLTASPSLRRNTRRY